VAAAAVAAATVAREWASVSAFPGCAAGWELQMGQQHMYGCTCVPYICTNLYTDIQSRTKVWVIC